MEPETVDPAANINTLLEECLTKAAPTLLAALKGMTEPWEGLSDNEVKRRYIIGVVDNVSLERLLVARSAIREAEGK